MTFLVTWLSSPLGFFVTFMSMFMGAFALRAFLTRRPEFKPVAYFVGVWLGMALNLLIVLPFTLAWSEPPANKGPGLENFVNQLGPDLADNGVWLLALMAVGGAIFLPGMVRDKRKWLRETQAERSQKTQGAKQ